MLIHLRTHAHTSGAHTDLLALCLLITHRLVYTSTYRILEVFRYEILSSDFKETTDTEWPLPLFILHLLQKLFSSK